MGKLTIQISKFKIKDRLVGCVSMNNFLVQLGFLALKHPCILDEIFFDLEVAKCLNSAMPQEKRQ
jgi:hypothetical protein